MRIVFLMLLAVITVPGFAQSSFEKSTDETGAIVYKGKMTFADLQKEQAFNWFSSGAEMYIPDSSTIQLLRTKLKEYQIVAVLGTWCDDSQVLVPFLYKTLILSDFPLNQYSMFGVDRSKQLNPNESQRYNVQKVPTIIVFKESKEVGRIVEVTKESIEKDLANIVNSQN